MRQHRPEAEGDKDLGLPHAGGAAAPRFEGPSATSSSEELEELLAAGGAAGAGPGATQPRFRSAASPAQLAAIGACKPQPEGAEERQLCSQELRPGALQGGANSVLECCMQMQLTLACHEHVDVAMWSLLAYATPAQPGHISCSVLVVA